MSRFIPRPVVAETAITCGRWRSFRATLAFVCSRSVAVMSHLFRASTVAHFCFMANSATRRSSVVTPSLASHTTIATSARPAACSERSCA
jgi:hypothetical protein